MASAGSGDDLDDMLGLDDADCVDRSVGESAICSTTGSYTASRPTMVEHRRSIDNTATTTGHVPGTGHGDLHR